MKDTALTRIHKELGARMVTFAGYNMPLEYTGVKDEHLAVRSSVGIFDVSHMGEFWIKGSGSEELIQKLTSNNVKNLGNGKIQYTCLPDGNGGIIDDLLVYKYSDLKYMLVVNASNSIKDWKWFLDNNDKGVSMDDASEEMSLIAVQGPNAVNTLQKLCDIDLAGIKYYNFEVATLAGIEEVIISATGYTGAGGFELYFRNHEAEQIWNAVMEAGEEFGIKPAGLAARDTLRMEMGYCLYGNEIDETTSPIEAGLGWITKFSEDNLFIDRERLEKQKSEGPKRRLVGFVMVDRGIPRKDYEILGTDMEIIGKVTSGTMSPTMNKGIGMGYVESGYSRPGTDIHIRIRNKEILAHVHTLPLYKKNKE